MVKRTVKDVIDTLTATIEGKRLLLKDLEKRKNDPDNIQSMAYKATMEFLKINLTELRNIKDDLISTQK